MNKIYKVIWSKVKHQYVVTSEFAHSCTKSTTSRVGKSAVAVLAALILTTGVCAVPAQAADPTLEELYYEQLNSTVHNDETSSPVVKLVEAPTAVPTAAKDGEQAVDNDTQTGEDGGMTGAADQYTVVNEDGFYASNTKGTHNTLSKDGLWVGGTDDNTGFYVDNDGNMRTTENAEIDGNLTVKGDTNLKNTTVDGDFKAKNDEASVVLNEDGLILRSSGAQGNGTISMNDGTLSLRNGNAENTTFVDVTTNGTTFSQLTDNSKTTISGGNIVTDSVTGLDNTEWKGTTNDASRAATEGQLADLSTTVSENAEGVVKWDQDANGDYQEGTIHGVTLQDGAITAANGNFSVDELGNVTATVADTNNSFSLTENGVSMKADNTTLDVTSGGVAIGNGAGSTYINGSEINTGTVLAGEMYVGTKDDGNAVVTKDQLTGTVGEATEGVVKWDKDENGDYQEGKLTVDSLTAAGGTFTISEEGIVNAGDKIVLNGTTGQVLADRIGTNDVTTQSFTAGNGKIKIDKDGKLTTTGDVLMQNGDGESISMTDGGLNLMTVDADNGTGMVTVANGAVRMIGGGNTTVKVDGSGTTFGTQTGMDTTTISGGNIVTDSVTGLDNTEWNGTTNDESRAATEGQLADLNEVVEDNAKGVVKWDNLDEEAGQIKGVTFAGYGNLEVDDLQFDTLTGADNMLSVDEDSVSIADGKLTVSNTGDIQAAAGGNTFSMTEENGISMSSNNTSLNVTDGGVVISNTNGATYVNGNEIDTGTVLAGEMYVGTKDGGNAVVTQDQFTNRTEGMVKWDTAADSDGNVAYTEGVLHGLKLEGNTDGSSTLSMISQVNGTSTIELNKNQINIWGEKGNAVVSVTPKFAAMLSGDNGVIVQSDSITLGNSQTGGEVNVYNDGTTTFKSEDSDGMTTIDGGRIKTGNGEFSNLLHAKVGRFDTLQVGERTNDNFAFYVDKKGSVNAANGAFRVYSDGGVKTTRVTGLTNTSWGTNPVVKDRAATEGQLQAVDTQVKANADAINKLQTAGQALKETSAQVANFAAQTQGINWDNLNALSQIAPMSLDVPMMTNSVLSASQEAKEVTRDPVYGTGSDGAALIDTNLTVTGDTHLKGDLEVDGKATFNNGVEITKGNLEMNNNKITGVANGDISETSKDAVNGSQLYGVQQDVEANAKNISTLGGAVNKLGNRIDEVGAGAAALAALHPLDFDPDNKWDFSAGYGNYRGESAVAFGAFYRPNEDTMFSVGGTVGNDDNMVNAGVSLKIGSGSSGVTTSRVAMAKEIKAMRDVVAKQDAQIQKLTAMVNALVGVKSEPDTTTMFPDVPENHWAYEAVAAMARSGLVKGYPDGEFKGDRTMTRYEFAQIIQNAIQAGAEVDSRLVEEFKPELEYFHIATVAKDKDGNPTIERVRAN